MRFWRLQRAAHPSLSPSAVPRGRRPPRRTPPAAAALAALVLVLGAVAVCGSALADPPSDGRPKAKASSFAPHHTKRHAYGAPVSKPILDKGKKSKQSAASAGKPQPIK